MYNLSFHFYSFWIKYLIIISSFLVNVFLLSYIVFCVYMVESVDINFMSGLLIIGLYIFTSSIYDYYLLISMTVKFDRNYLYIIKNKNVYQKVGLSTISKISRKFYFFYLIVIRKDNVKRNVYIFISPNPSFTTPVVVKELIKLMHNEKVV